MSKLRLSGKERLRIEVLRKVKGGGLTLGKAAELLGLSYRQMLRVHARYELEGIAGLQHGLRDQSSNRRISEERRKRVLKLYETKYNDFGPTLATEYLLKLDGED